MSVVYIDVDKIHPNNYNPNVMDSEKFEALVDFCKTHGAAQLDPIWVRKDGMDSYEAIDGEHRWKAAKEVGWKRLRAFIIEMGVDDAKAFNVRKNRERGRLDAIKLGKIFSELSNEKQQIEIAKQFGINPQDVCELIKIYREKDKILNALNSTTSKSPISYYKARKILRELKREERGETEQPRETKEIVDEMVKEVAPALEKAFENVKPYDKHNPERNKLVLNMLLKNLVEGLLFCPVCKQSMMECSHCHTSLAKMKEAKQL